MNTTISNVSFKEQTTAVPATTNKYDPADDAIWILTSTFIIFTMQSGFGLLESGSVSSKNEVNIMVKNAADVIFGGLTYWIFGYAFSFGDDKHPLNNPFCGWGYFFVDTSWERIGEVYPKFFFQASFATTATTIVSGAMAERCKLEAYIIFSLLNTLVFCFPSHWVWGENGWLHRLGCVDIAGAGPVHLVGGVTGLVATMMLRPRYGRYLSNRPPPMASPTNAVLGMFMIWWGWLGFNCGSTFGISGGKWKLAARSAIATFLASVSGGVVAVVVSYIVKKGKFDVTYMINGILGSLVGITAHCAMAQPWEGLIVGSISSLLALGGVELLDKLQIDDPVGCVSVHAICAAWSLITVGFFAKRDDLRSTLRIEHSLNGIFYGGSGYLLGIQVLAVVSISIWTAASSFLLLKLIEVTIGLRLALHHEILGADLVEHSVGEIEYDKKQGSIKMRDKTVYLHGMEPSEIENVLNHNTRKKSTIDENIMKAAGVLNAIKGNLGNKGRTKKVQEVDNETTYRSRWQLALTREVTQGRTRERNSIRTAVAKALRRGSVSNNNKLGSPASEYSNTGSFDRSSTGMTEVTSYLDNPSYVAEDSYPSSVGVFSVAKESESGLKSSTSDEVHPDFESSGKVTYI